MTRILCGLALAVAVAACAHEVPTQLVYSSGFSFAQYDYVVVGKTDGRDTATSLYGLDVEFANLLSRYNMKVIGDKEYVLLSPEIKRRTLFARMSVSATNQRVLLSISFDDSTTGRIGASVSSSTRGNIFNPNSRSKAFEVASGTLIKALEQDKGIKITTEKAPEEQSLLKKFFSTPKEQ